MGRALRQIGLPLLIVVVVAAGLYARTRGPLGGDEHYIFVNLTSPAWSDRLAAFNADFPGTSGGHWYSGLPSHQRRYVRLLPSALMSFEAWLWGSSPLPFKWVSLALHLTGCLLGYRLLRLWLGSRPKAAIIVAVVGLHPAAAQPVNWVACQHLPVAVIMTLLAANALAEAERGAGRAAEVALVACAFLAMTSYEAAIGLPLMLIFADAWIRRWPHQEAPRSRWASLLALYPLYGLIVRWNTHGVTRSDASYRASPEEFLGTAAADFSNYLVKSLIGRPPFYDGQLYAWIGHPLSLAGLLLLFGLVLWRLSRRRAAILGIVFYLGFLAPPLVARAAVSWTNYPTTRQLYLPLIGVAIVLGALFKRPLGWRHVVLATAVCLAMVFSHWRLATPSTLAAAHAEMGGYVREELRGADPEAPVVVIGHSGCGYDVRFDAGRHRVWNLIPLTVRRGLPELTALDDRTLAVHDANGLSVPLVVPPPPPGQRFEYEVPELARTGEQRLEIATVTTPPRERPILTDLRFSFDRPLDSHVFFSLTGCTLPQRVRFD